VSKWIQMCNKVTKDSEEEYVRATLKAILYHKKWKGNAAVPSPFSKLREHYEETKKGHPDLSLKQYIADQSCEGDHVDPTI
jgi:hypothetical protein